MRYCKTCKLSYEAPLTHCLFCNNTLTDHSTDVLISQTEGNYPVYKKIHHIRSIFVRILTFVTIIANFVCLFVNYNTSNPHFTWSIYVVATTVYVLLTFITFTKRSSFLSKIVKLVLYTLFLLLVIAINYGGYHWYTDYVLPILLMTINLYSSLYLFGRKQRIYDYSIYSISLSILGLLLGLLIPTKAIHNPWASVVCVIYSAVTLLAILFFSPKAMREELGRRFFF